MSDTMEGSIVTRHTYVQVNGSLCHVVQYGSGSSLFRSADLEKAVPDHVADVGHGSPARKSGSPSSKKKVIVLVPGNPGLLGFYHDFLSQLCFKLSEFNRKSQPTVIAIGHNNFDHPDEVSYKAEQRISVDLADLNFVEKSIAETYRREPNHIELQVLNKLIIIKRLLNIDLEETKLIFIGHSIGAYVILRLLQDRSIALAHGGSVLIHPALENLALTEKGSHISKLFSYKLDLLLLQPVVLFLEKLLTKSMKLALVRWLCSKDFIENSSHMAVESATQLFGRKAWTALVQMAKSELSFIRNMNIDNMIRPHACKLKLVYATKDHWVNSNNRILLRRLLPELHLEEQDAEHAFVMNPQTVTDYAVKVNLFIQEFLDRIERAEITW